MEVLDWRRATRAGRLLRRARQALRGGATVGFPAAGGHVAVAEAAHAVKLNGRLEVVVSGPGAALDWATALGPAGRRLTRRAWPGPLVLVTAEGVERGLASRLEAGPRLLDGGELRMRPADHAALADMVERVGVPLVAVPLDGPAGVDVLVSDGRWGGPGYTAVRVAGDRWEVTEAGGLEADAVARCVARTVVFVCTGNTCRSPLAEALCKLRLAERLGCAADELAARGWAVTSAGVAAAAGMPAAAEAMAVAKARGADLSRHRSRPLDADVADGADWLVAMTGGHLRALRGAGLGAVSRLLSPDGDDVPDPIGGPREAYERCAEQLDGYLARAVNEWLEAR